MNHMLRILGVYYVRVVVNTPGMVSDCPICLESKELHSQCRLKCGHMVCNRCITQMEHPTCPVCRQPIFPGHTPEDIAEEPPARTTVATQIEEDARLARSLSRNAEAGRVPHPVVTADAHQQYHHVGGRLTYSLF